MKTRNTPSVAFTLTVLGFVLLVPFLVISIVQIRTSRAAVASAEQVQESADRLAILLRLNPALDDELLATGWQTGGRDLLSQLPEAATPLLGLDGSGSLEEDRALVDSLLERLGDDALTADLAAARSNIGVDIIEVVELGAEFEAISRDIDAKIQRELLTLNSAAAATGDAEVGRAAYIAAEIANVQAASVELDGRWALLEATQFVEPNAGDVRLFYHQLTEFEQQAHLLDQVLPVEGDVRNRWNDVSNSAALEFVMANYAETADRFTIEGLNDNQTSGLDISITELASALSLAGRISEVLESAERVSEGLNALIGAALVDLETSAQTALDEANSERQTTFAWIVAAAGLVVFIGFMGAAMIVRPVRRLADAAHRLRRGDLTTVVPEKGPAELLIGARALNGALASLRHAESQAIALAEVRLDDPILEEAAPGELGASLQAAVGRLARSLTEREDIQRKLEHEASHDALTGLANRRALLEHLETELSAGKLTALLFLDLDDFKSLNDAHGHHAGDEMLEMIASRARAAVGDRGLPGRLGGDEFVIVTSAIESADDAIAMAEEVLHEVNSPVVLDGTTLSPEASIGIGLADRPISADELLREADLAVYQAKSAGKGRIEICDAELRAAHDSRFLLEEAIRQGIEANEFVLFGQPLVNAHSHEPVSIEALIRWDRPGQDMLVSPAGFIPVAEMSDLIIDIDCWVLRAVAELLADSHNSPRLPISVNISGRHLSSGRLVRHVESVLARHNFDPSLLVLEVTETALLDVETASRDLADLRALGVRVALDDFGSGFMSLGNLRSLPVDELKIDASFVQDLESHESRSIAQLAIDAGRLLKLRVVAEGVETVEQAHTLSSMGADVLQGYYFSRPAPINDIGDPTALAA